MKCSLEHGMTKVVINLQDCCDLLKTQTSLEIINSHKWARHSWDSWGL